jgi:hypothetical protein
MREGKRELYCSTVVSAEVGDISWEEGILGMADSRIRHYPIIE